MHDPEYVEAVREILQDVRRADDVLEGLENYVSRRADMGMAVRGYPPEEFGSWISKNVPGKGRIRVLYRYDDVSVTMLEAWLIPEHLEGKF